MKSRVRSSWVFCAIAILPACTSDAPSVVASNCDDPNGCGKQVAALHLDAVDILMVIDNSGSIAPQAEALKAELPRLLNAIVRGNDGDMNFPPANSVHVAVTTSDIGVGSPDAHICSELGNDGVFVKPGEVGVSCDVSYPGYFAYEADAAPIAVVDSVACVPLVFSKVGDLHPGCGFEQSLEAGLKAVWPAMDTSVNFLSGTAHGSSENKGFLRDSSLFVVVVVTDEDDCSSSDLDIFRSDYNHVEEGYYLSDLNVRCVKYKSKLYDVQRYVDRFKALRPGNDNVIFAVLGGIPADLISEDARGAYDFTVPAQVDAFYDSVLAAESMQEHYGPPANPAIGAEVVTPSCSIPSEPMPGEGVVGPHLLFPPRRLVQVAKAFGNDGVLGSLCANDFGSTTGRLIHAIGERLSAASQH